MVHKVCTHAHTYGLDVFFHPSKVGTFSVWPREEPLHLLQREANLRDLSHSKGHPISLRGNRSNEEEKMGSY